MPTINVSDATETAIYWALRQARSNAVDDATTFEVYDKALSEFEAAQKLPALDRAQGQVWERVEYGDIYDPATAKPLRPDYERICEKWHDFNDSTCDTEDGFEYAICRLTQPAAEPVAMDEPGANKNTQGE